MGVESGYFGVDQKSNNNEVKKISRREFLGEIKKVIAGGVVAGIGGGMAVKYGGKLLESFSEKKEVGVDSITNERFSGIGAQLEEIEKSSKLQKTSQEDIEHWKAEFTFLKKVDEKNDRIEFLTRLSNLEKAVSEGMEQ